MDGAKLLQVLDEQNVAVHDLIKNTGRVFGAINERRGALRELILNSAGPEATASRDEALAETFAIFPTFLDEQGHHGAARGLLAQDAPARERPEGARRTTSGPRLRDLATWRRPREPVPRPGPADPREPQRRAGLERTPAAEPLAEGLHTFFPELNPILSYFFHQTTIAAFITNGGADLAADYGTSQRGQTQMGIIEDRSFQPYKYGDDPPDWARGNAYMHRN